MQGPPVVRGESFLPRKAVARGGGQGVARRNVSPAKWADPARLPSRTRFDGPPARHTVLLFSHEPSYQKAAAAALSSRALLRPSGPVQYYNVHDNYPPPPPPKDTRGHVVALPSLGIFSPGAETRTASTPVRRHIGRPVPSPPA